MAQFICLCTVGKCTDERNNQESCDVWNANKKKEERIWHALQIAEARDFVMKLPQGLDTFLGERGAGLSEGQMQRIAIARAIYANRPILVLDESTSALDEETEKKVLSNLREMTEKTVLIVTHRKAALEICDMELRFSEGSIREIPSLKLLKQHPKLSQTAGKIPKKVAETAKNYSLFLYCK